MPTPVPEQITIRYGCDPAQFGQLHLPAADGPVSVVVVVHGGYWRAGYGLELGTPLAVDLASHGFAAWNVEYRRVGNGGGWPHTLHDVAAAVDALAGVVAGAAQRAGVRLDVTDVRAVGHSAGGQLAVWSAARALLPAGQPGADPLVPITRVVAQAGVLDLVGADAGGLGDGAVRAFLGATAAQAPARYLRASPVALLPVGVPVTCVHGESDLSVPISQSEVYVAAALAAGDPAALVRLPGVEHFALIDPTTPAWAACRAVVLAPSARAS